MGRSVAVFTRKKPYPTSIRENTTVIITGTINFTKNQYKVFYLVVKPFKFFMNYCSGSAENMLYMKNRYINALIILLLFSSAGQICAEVTFGGIDLYSRNETLFTADVDLPGDVRINSYKTLFQADLSTRLMQQLTFFPENVLYLSEKGVIQISNRFGVFRSDRTLKQFQSVIEFPSFVNGSQIRTGKTPDTVSSPDGSYLVYIVPKTAGYGRLILYDLNNDEEIIVTENIEYTYSSPRVIWSSDSKIMIYEKGNTLFYYSVDKGTPGNAIAENFRKIGEGKISNVIWSGDGVYYLKDSFIFKIRSTELFSSSLYSEHIDAGEVKGKIPFTFEPSFDKFWISPEGNEVVVCKGGRDYFYYRLDRDVMFDISDVMSLPHIFLPRNSSVKKLVWGENGIVTILTGTIVEGKVETALFRLNTLEKGDDIAFRQLDGKGVFDIVLSDDSMRIAVIRENSIDIKWYDSWNNIKEYDYPAPLECIWKNSDEILVFGSMYTSLIKTRTGESDILTLSQPSAYGFDRTDSKIVVSNSGSYYKWDPDGIWEKTTERTLKNNGIASDDYRIYLEKSSGRSYRNMVFVRDIKKYRTDPLFPPPAVEYDRIPDSEDSVDFSNFTHGSRTRGRYVSIVFNAVKNDSGLTEILNTLSDYGVKATFFINGEFIKRHPGAVKEIADSGHEAGSLFYYYFNLTDASFKIDSDFIKKGLARNEDEFFRTTGKELSLLWHAPYYFVNSRIIDSAKQMNYTYVGRDVITLDWKSDFDTNYGTERFYKPAAELLEDIARDKKPGSIITITIGRPDKGRKDYLFQQLENLINNLISSGYSIVPVSQQIEIAK